MTATLGARLDATADWTLALPWSRCEIGWGPCWDEANRRAAVSGRWVTVEFQEIVLSADAPCQNGDRLAMTTAKEHLDWCVERAMQYVEMGDMPNAWASFGSDVRKHEGTEHIFANPLFGMAMISGLYDNPKQFRDFISGWAVEASSTP